MKDVSAIIDAARDLAAQDPFDIQAALPLLAKLLREDVDAQTRGAIRQALLVTALGYDQSGRSITVARHALSRVIVLLEKNTPARPAAA